MKNHSVGAVGAGFKPAPTIARTLVAVLLLAAGAAAQTLAGGAKMAGGALLVPPACPPVASGAVSVNGHANTSCTLNGIQVISYGAANSIYNPSGGDCVTTGTGFTCPTQDQLEIVPDCGTGGPLAGCSPSTGGVNATRFIISLNNLFGTNGNPKSVTGPASMTITVHYALVNCVKVGVRFPVIGGSGNFSITGTQTVDGTWSSTGSCSTSACGSANFPACLGSGTCVVNGSVSPTLANAPHTETDTLVLNCASGTCVFKMNEFGMHNYGPGQS
ncbi:MAG TPA: hypothetical protein VGZ29_01225 [Terriglobia bacterium]|nr:hypothetical protein [Terriglobia bacterium]